MKTRTHPGLVAIPFVGIACALPQGIGTSNSVRGLGALIGGDADPFFTYTPFASRITHIKTTHALETALGGLFPAIAATASSSIYADNAASTAHTSVATQNEIFFSPAVLPASSTANETTIAPTEVETQSTIANPISGGSKTWKIIGVSVIAVTFVTGTIFLVVFFDHWWRFLRDLIFGKKKAADFEDLVPDWEKRTWEVRLAEEDGHRYPSMSTLASDTLSRQLSETRRPENDIRHPFPARPPPQTNVGLGLSADCSTIYHCNDGT